MNNFLKEGVGNGIEISFDLSTFHAFVKLNRQFQIDFTKSGNFHLLLRFSKIKLMVSAFGPNLPNISNSLDNIVIRCSLLSDSIVFGKRSNVLFSFPTSTKVRALTFKISMNNYLWNKVNTKTITEARFCLTDGEDRPIDLNSIDILITLVFRELD